MKILVINSGSSSLKFQLFDMARNEAVLASGIVERIGQEKGNLTYKNLSGDSEEKHAIEEAIPDHNAAMRLVTGLLTDPEKGVISDASDVAGVGHRVVHGGEHFHATTMVDDEVLAAIEEVSPLAPLHNPANLVGIRVARELFPEARQVAVFDTAFHQTLQPEAYLYAVPRALYDELKVRRYGFHGTSHKFVANEAAKMLGKELSELNIITVHLGNGCSMAAVKKGQCVDTTMGLTPLAGLVMGTRCGDIDPSVYLYLAREKGLNIEQIDGLLNKESGLMGLCGMSDMRDIHAAIEKGDEHARQALEVATYRVKKYIGSYIAAMGGVDAVVFTAGIGENDDIVRKLSVQGLESLGIELDEKANEGRVKQPKAVHAEGSKVSVLVIPTNEELAIARSTQALLD